MSEFKKYIAVTKFVIGQDSENSYQIEKGDPIEYDMRTGKTRVHGEEHVFPRLKSAVKAKWMVDPSSLGLDGALPEYQRPSAEISMRHPTEDDGDPTIASTTLTEEERQVGTVSQVRQGNFDVSSQEGEVLGIKFATAAKQEGASVDKVSPQDIGELERGTVGSKKAAFDAEQERRMQREIAELKAQLASQQPQTQVREGIQFTTEGVSTTAADTTPDSNTDVWDGDDATVVASVADEDVAAAIPEDKEARLQVARQMLPTFDWDFGAHWKTKLKALEEDGTPLFVCAAYAVETDAMKKHIAKKFPKLGLG